MKKLIFMALVAFTFSACNSGKTEGTEATKTDSTLVKADTVALVDSIAVSGLAKLPNTKLH